MDTILVVNAGSSSVKFQVFAVENEGDLRRQIKGQMDGIGTRPRLRASGPSGDPLADRTYPIEAVADVPAAMSVAGAWLRDERNIDPIAVGHRVVHGGHTRCSRYRPCRPNIHSSSAASRTRFFLPCGSFASDSSPTAR